MMSACRAFRLLSVALAAIVFINNTYTVLSFSSLDGGSGRVRYSPSKTMILKNDDTDSDTDSDIDSSSSSISRIGVLTSGGDCPSINACIRAIYKTAKIKGIEVWGFPRGLPGLLKMDGSPPDAFKLDETFQSASMLNKGGSRLGGFVAKDFLGTDSLTLEEKSIRISLSLQELGIDGIIATGGDTSFDRIANLLQHNNAGSGSGVVDTPPKFSFVGIPKTIDNDIPETIYPLGFQSAVSTAAKAIASVRDTAESHRRIIVVECMGRDAGFLTLHAGLGGGADTILLPEFPIDKSSLLEHVKKIYSENQCSVIAVSESIRLPQTGTTSRYKTADGRQRLGGSAEAIARFLAESLKVDARHIVLGHTQRGGSPNSFDKVLATTLGAYAVNVLCDGQSEVFVTRNGNKVNVVPLDKVRDTASSSKSIDPDYPELQAALAMGIYCGSI
jgi:6-phosphofructokinase